MKIPTLSVVMANYNHAYYIAEALHAIVSQSFQPLEVLICDDASTDNSAEIIQAFVDKYQFVRLIENETNCGAVKSYNSLVALATGDYLYGAAADDKILPGFFEKSMKLLKKYPQAGLCSTLVNLINENGEPKNIRLGVTLTINDSFINRSRVESALYKYGSWIGGTATIFKRSALIESGGFIEKLHAYSDGFIEQVIAIKHGVCFIPEKLVCYRFLDDSYGNALARNFDAREGIINNVADLMKGTFSTAHINNYKINELFSLKKDKIFSYRQRKIRDIKKSDFENFLKIISEFAIDIICVCHFLGILVYTMVRHVRYFNIINKIYYRYKKYKIV